MLDFIGIKEVSGEHKKIVFYCPGCKSTHERSEGYGKYPSCPNCKKPLKVCWSYKGFPEEYCDKCESRFDCFTERGNF